MSHFQAGEKVMRYLSSERVPMPLTVTRVHEGLVWCGPWAFDDETGAEEDPELGWGRALGITGSMIEKVSEEKWEAERAKLVEKLRQRSKP